MTSISLADVVKAYDVRGIVPDQLDARVTRALGAAFAEVVVLADDKDDKDDKDDRDDSADRSADRGTEAAPACVIGHDMRDTSPELSRAFADGARSRGVDVTLIGLASTDGLYYASGALGLPGARPGGRSRASCWGRRRARQPRGSPGSPLGRARASGILSPC